MTPMPLVRPIQMRFSGEQRFVLVDPLVESAAKPLDILLELVVSLILQAADAEGVRGQPRAAVLLENFQDLFPFAQAIKQRRQRADVQRVRPQPEDVAGDALQFREDGADHPRRGGASTPSSFSIVSQ